MVHFKSLTIFSIQVLFFLIEYFEDPFHYLSNLIKNKVDFNQYKINFIEKFRYSIVMTGNDVKDLSYHRHALLI